MNNAEHSNREQWRDLYKNEQWYDLYKNVSTRRDKLEKWNALQAQVYKYSGYILSVSTPLLAATVTYLSTVSDKISMLYASITGLLLTFLTVLSGVLKPGQRFLSAVQLSHELEEFKTDFEIELRKLSTENPPNLDAIYTALHTRNRQLSVVGESMALGTLSASVPEKKQEQHSGGGSRTP
jgi:hypothetical protein